MKPDCLVASPCSNPQLDLEAVLKGYSEAGYENFEVFTSWAKSAFDYEGDPEYYLEYGRKYGMKFTSMHLPPIDDDVETSVAKAISATKFAAKLGVECVIYKGTSRGNYIAGAPAYLDGIAETGVTPVLQNHVGTAITTLEDYAAVINGINDQRMKTLHEVGQFHSIGVSWQQGYELLGTSIVLVHVKDQIGENKVPFGTGEVDFSGLFTQLDKDNYPGRIVVEMEIRDVDDKQVFQLLKDAHEYLKILM